MAETNQNIFQDLPQVLVEELLSKSRDVGKKILNAYVEISQNRNAIRAALKERNFIIKDTDLPAVSIPTTCGIDGSYAIEKLLAADLAVCAAVAV